MSEGRAAGLLRLETMTGKIWFEGKPLPVTMHWSYVFGLLVLRVLEGGSREVMVDEVGRLPTWAAVNPRSIRTSVFRFFEKLAASGFEFIASPERERTRRFLLNPLLVKRVRCDLGVDELKTWLGLSLPAPSPGDLQVVMAIERAQVVFEKGRFAEAKDLCARVLEMPTRVDDRLRMLVLNAWATFFTGSKSEAKAALEVAQQALAEHKVISGVATVPDQVSARTEASVWIQTARFHYLYGEFRPAETALLKAEKLLSQGDAREWSSIHAGRGYMARQLGDLELGERHHRLALDFASRAYWRTGVCMQLNNLAAVQIMLHQKYEDTDAPRAHNSLVEARRWCEESIELADELDLGGNADQEFNLVFICLKLKDFDAAKHWLEKGRRSVNAAGTVADLACFHQLNGELEFAQGNREAAIAEYETAVQKMATLEDDNWDRLVRDRLKGLRSNSKKSKPLKLW
jgi:tetratricopeptide (TPR) repeat protein